MDKSENNENRKGQDGSLSPSISKQTQRDNEERFEKLQIISSLKPLMEKLKEQNGEKSRQEDTAVTTSSASAQSSDTWFKRN